MLSYEFDYTESNSALLYHPIFHILWHFMAKEEKWINLKIDNGHIDRGTQKRMRKYSTIIYHRTKFYSPQFSSDDMKDAGICEGIKWML